MIGTTLSHYRIHEELGRGGMGIVYKAQDTKLERTVAIKVLPASALSNEDDRARFYREAKAAASLNHPHIAQIFQIDEAVPDGFATDDVRSFIAMEYIEGGTLEDRIKQGPFKLEDAVRIASQVAEALKAAHAKDIVHRDIKSANIMLTTDGHAKVLDFGLAQTAASTKLTRMGSTLGTVAYMSPEQARGEEVDSRTDLWALGVVLYEMIAGVNPFGGDYEQAVVYGILNSDPEPLTAVRTGVPMGLEWIISKCLAKPADDRYQRADDLIVDLRTVDLTTLSGMSRVSHSQNATATDRPVNQNAASRSQKSLILVLASFSGLATVALLYLLFFNTPSTESSLPLKLLTTEIPGVELAWWPSSSQDGGMIAFNAAFGFGQGLTLHDFSTGETVRLTDRQVEASSFSPDGSQLAYSLDNLLYRMRLDQRIQVPLGESIVDDHFIQWLDNENIFFVSSSELKVANIETGESTSYWSSDFMGPEPVLGSAYLAAFWPLPDQKAGLATLVTDSSTFAHQIAYVKDGRLSELVDQAAWPVYSQDGFIVFGTELEEVYLTGKLMSQLFDVERGELIGSRVPFPLENAKAIYHWTVNAQGEVISPNMGVGNAIFESLVRIDPVTGTNETVFEGSSIINPRLSNDERHTVLASWNFNRGIPEVHIVNNQTGLSQKVIDEGSQPTWYPTGNRIQFMRGERLWEFDLDGQQPASVSPYQSADTPFYYPEQDLMLYTYLAEGSTKIGSRNLLTGDAFPVGPDGLSFSTPSLSPDGGFMLALSGGGESGKILSWRYPDGAIQEIAAGDLSSPVWSPDGKWVYFFRGQAIVRVPVNLDNGAGPAGPERVIFESEALDLSRIDIYQNGDILASLRDRGNLVTERVKIFQNWGDHLRRLAEAENR